MVVLDAYRCMVKIYALLPAFELISPLSVCATPHHATSFSHSPLLCLISLSLSSQAPACPRDSEPLNIHPLSSIAPTVLLEEGEKEKKMALNYSGPNQGYFGRLAWLRWGGTSVCVFWCGGSLNSMSIFSCHNCRHYTIMLRSSNVWISPDYNFPSWLKDFNRSSPRRFLLMHRWKGEWMSPQEHTHRLKLSYTPSRLAGPSIRPEWSWTYHAWSRKWERTVEKDLCKNITNTEQHFSNAIEHLFLRT